ncbi:MAG: hypothetical protein AB7I79_01430 [Rhizobiaceae bacterium]
MTESDETPLLDILKGEIVYVFLAGPAAFGLLGHLNERLDFSDTLTRIVLGFQVLIDAFWMRVYALIGIELPYQPKLLTISLLFVLPVTIQHAFGRRSRSRHRVFLSVLATFGAVIIMTYDTAPMYAFYFAFVSVPIGIGLIFVHVYLADPGERLIELDRFGYFLCCYFASVTLCAITIIHGEHIKFIPFYFILYFISIASMFYLIRRVEEGTPGPLYIVVFAAGVVGVDWVGHVLIPAIDAGLDRLGV